MRAPLLSRTSSPCKLLLLSLPSTPSLCISQAHLVCQTLTTTSIFFVRLQKLRYPLAVLDFIFHVCESWLLPMLKKLLYLNDFPALIPSPSNSKEGNVVELSVTHSLLYVTSTSKMSHTSHFRVCVDRLNNYLQDQDPVLTIFPASCPVARTIQGEPRLFLAVLRTGLKEVPLHL